MRVKFEKYEIIFEGHHYCILIPRHIDQLWISGYGNPHWGVNWIGNRNGLKALLYSATVLGFNPTDKIIYFPIRENLKPFYYENPRAFPGESKTWIDDCDLVFTTHQVPLRRSKWKKMKEIIRYKRPDTYILDYNKERTEAYFSSSFEKWKRSTACRHKEYLIEIMQDKTLFQVFSRMQFQQIYLTLCEFLKDNLEQNFIKWFGHGDPWDAVWLEYTQFFYRENKEMMQHPWVIYYDMRHEELVKKMENREAMLKRGLA